MGFAHKCMRDEKIGTGIGDGLGIRFFENILGLLIQLFWPVFLYRVVGVGLGWELGAVPECG